MTALVPDVPSEVAEIVGTMLAKSPGERFQSMADVANALEPYAEWLPQVGEQDGSFVQFIASLRKAAPVADAEPASESSEFGRWLADSLEAS